MLSILLLASPLKGWASGELSQESENFFNSFLFVDFHNQLKNFIASERTASEKELEYITYIETFTPGTAEENRIFYHTMIDKLRLLINYNQGHSDFLDHFCLRLFESVEMWDSIVRFQNELFPTQEQYPDPMNATELFNLTNEIYSQTLANELYNGCNKVSKETNDQMRFGNFPYYLYTLDKTKVIRIPCITKDVNQTIAVVEEFYHYLKVNKELNKKLLYVNLITQKYDKPDNGDPKRRKAIESLEADPRIEGSIFVATFDKNSPFYFQTGPYEQANDSDLFIGTFLTMLFTKQNPVFSFPRCLNEAKWRHTCQELFHHIHVLYFDHRRELTVQERKNFIHIAYIEMIKKLINILNVDTMNISCVNTVDRGISLLSELYIDQIFEKKGVITRDEADHFTSLVLIHPIILRNRPAHDYRLDRIISAALTKQSVAIEKNPKWHQSH